MARLQKSPSKIVIRPKEDDQRPSDVESTDLELVAAGEALDGSLIDPWGAKG